MIPLQLPHRRNLAYSQISFSSSISLSLPLSPCEASQLQSSGRGPESFRTENNGAVHSSVSQKWLDFKGKRAKMLVEDR